MNARHRAAVAITVLALALGATACGGGSSATKTTNTVHTRLLEARWKAGLVHWRGAMQHALNGISIIFATQASFGDLQRPRSTTSTSLAQFEFTLGSCDTSLRRLGPIPVRFRLAGRYARVACSSLEQGEQRVETVVDKLRNGRPLDPMDPLGGATNLLGSGQSSLGTAVHALAASPV